MKKLLWVSLLGLFLVTSQALAKGGASSGGHSSGGGGHASFSSASRGGFSSSRSVASPSSSYNRPSVSSTRTTTTTTRTYRSNYVSPGGYYGGMGMGYGYSNGLLTGLIIADLMHPQGTTVYTGGGYNGNALLYPDGRVVNQQGYQVGQYSNGQYTPVDGGFVAQPVPQDAGVQQPAPQPVVVNNNSFDGGDVAVIIFLTFILSWFVFMLLAI